MAQQNLDNELTRLRIDKSRKRPRRAGRRWTLILVLLALALGGYAYYVKGNAPLPVKLASAEITTAVDPNTPVLTAGGYIIPRNKIEISSKIIGRVEAIYVDRGSKVKAGDVLLKLEDNDLKAQVGQAEATLDAAKARLAELLAGSRPEEIAAAQAAVNAAQATLGNAAAELKRVESLDADEIISRQAIDKVREQYGVAQANLESARKQFELVKKGPRQETIDSARAQVAQAEANLAYARAQLDYTVIRAPITGTVLEKLAKQGELVSFQNFGGTRGAKSSVVSMADLSDLQVEIDVNESDLSKVHMAQPTEIRMDSLPDVVLKGAVDEIAPEADRQKGTVQVKVRIENPPPAIHPEVNARVTFLESAQARANAAPTPKVYVPRAALVSVGDTTRVFIVGSTGAAEEKQIKVGDENQRGVRVLDGLKGGERIVLNPPEALKSGMKVTQAS